MRFLKEKHYFNLVSIMSKYDKGNTMVSIMGKYDNGNTMVSTMGKYD